MPSSGGMDKLQRVQDEINEATDVMRENIEQVVGRGEHLELLVDKSADFQANASAFQKQSVGLKRALWWKNVKMIAMFVSMMLGVALMVLWFKCGLTLHLCKAKPPA
jgi:vesicle-associated membrane protein 7